MKMSIHHAALASILLFGPLVNGQSSNEKQISLHLKRELAHPSKSAHLSSVCFSPDGKRIIAWEKGGIIQLWDAESGKQLTKIDVGDAPAWTSFQVAPDWKTVYAARNNDVAAWDVGTGRIGEIYKHPPDRCIRRVVFSPDCTNFVVFEWSDGASEIIRHTSLWDVRTKKARPLVDSHWPIGPVEAAFFSPDGKLLAIQAETDVDSPRAIHVFDLATTTLKTAIAPAAKDKAWVHCLGFSPDSFYLLGTEFLEDAKRAKRYWLKMWDPATGKDLDSVEMSANDFIFNAAFHMAYPPFSRRLAVSTIKVQTLMSTSDEQFQSNLILFDIRENKLVKSFTLDLKRGIFAFAFSPNGRWIAMLTQDGSMQQAKEAIAKTAKMPPSHIHLVDVATGATRQTLDMPGESITEACFSPDSSLLGVGSIGRVLLYEVETPRRGKD